MKIRLFNDVGLGTNSAQGMHIDYLMNQAIDKVLEYAKAENIDIRDVEIFCETTISSRIARHILKESGLLANFKN